MNRALWILQIVFGIYFIGVGLVHFIVPDNLPTPMSWMYDLSDGVHYVSGTLEILGGLGLILPSLLKIQPRLTPLAGAGLGLVMLAAAIWHAARGDWVNIPQNLIITAVVWFIAYGRWKLSPIAAKAPATPA